MRPHLTIGQLTILVGTAVGICVLLVFIIFALRKALRSGLRGEADPQTPRASDSSAFALATMQGVIANLKEEQRRAENARRELDQRAEMNTRLLEVLAGALDEALVVFTREGYIRLINPPARAILGADTWSRRRYDEILAPGSALANLIRACLEAGAIASKERIELPLQDGELQALLVSVFPLQARTGNIAGAVCLLRDAPDSPTSDMRKDE